MTVPDDQLCRWRFARSSVSLLVAAWIGLVLLVPVDPVLAQDPGDCDRPVVDTSGLVDVGAVEEAIAGVDPEAVIVVRSFERVPLADLVAEVDELVATCFGDPDLGVRRDVVVLSVSVIDRLSDVLVGARWGVAVPDPARIRSEVMAPYFADADYTGGLVAAVEEIGLGIDRQLAAASESSQDTAEDDGVGIGVGGGAGVEGQGEPDESVDGDLPRIGSEVDEPVGIPDGQGQSPLAVGFGVLGIGACGGAVVILHRRRRLSAARDNLQRAVSPALTRLGVIRERHARLAAQADVWGRTSAGRTRSSLAAQVHQADVARGDTDQAAGMLHQTIPDGTDDADRDQLVRGRARVSELTRALDGHDEALDRLATFGAHLEHLRVAIPAKAELLDAEVAEAGDLADLRASEGWQVEEPRADLQVVSDALTELDLSPVDLDLITLSELLEEAEALLFATRHHLQSLPSQVVSLKRWSEELAGAGELELRRTEDVRRKLTEVAAVHAIDSWQWASDHPEQAVEAVERAERLRVRAIGTSVPEQRFDDAGRELDRAGLELIVADDLLDQVDDLLIDLEQARRGSTAILEQSRLVLASLLQYLGRHAADLEPELLDRPVELGRAVDGLERDLLRHKPNYLRVAETGERLNRRIDDLLSEAEEQHVAAEARRRELSREVARAARAIGRARRSLGWELLRSRDGDDLDRLEATLADLPDDLVRAIEDAADIADDALRVQERIIARRRRRGLWVDSGDSGGFWSTGGGWSSGDSGSSSRSSGGRSFGGGGASGGRSFGGHSRSSGGRSFGGGRSSGGF